MATQASVALSLGKSRKVHPESLTRGNSGRPSRPASAHSRNYVEDEQDDNRITGETFIPVNVSQTSTLSNEMDSCCSKNMVIDPRSDYLKSWELVVISLLLFTAVVTPFEVGFLTTEINTLFFINRIVDLLFLKDLVMQFHMGFIEKGTAGQEVTQDRLRIAQGYLFGWFTVDFISILPFDVIGLMIGNANISRLKILRVLRLLRLFKLVKLLKSADIFNRWQSRLGFKYSLMALAKYIAFIIFVAHWMACLFHVVTVFESEDTVTWVVQFFCDGIVSGCDPGISELYCASLYHATMTLTTIGYGDLVANTTAERWVSIMIQLVGASLYAYIVGVASGIVASMNKQKMQFQETMDELNEFMEDKELDGDLTIRLREYFQHLQTVDKMRLYASLLERMSPGLRGEVAMITYGNMIQAVPYLAQTGSSFVTQVALKLVPMVLSPGELIVPAGARAEHLYFVADGVVSTQGKLHTTGAYFGQEVIMQSGRHSHPVRAVSYCNLYTVSATDLNLILEDFPRVKKWIRKAVMRMAFARDIRKVLSKLKGPQDPEEAKEASDSVLCKIESLERKLLQKDRQLQVLLQESTALQQQISEQMPKCQVFSSILVNKPDERKMLKEIEVMQEELATSSQDTVRLAQHKFWKTRRLLGQNSLLLLESSGLQVQLAKKDEVPNSVTLSELTTDESKRDRGELAQLHGVRVSPAVGPAALFSENNPLSDATDRALAKTPDLDTD